MTIEEFVEARITEDEATAQTAAGRSGDWHSDEGGVLGGQMHEPYYDGDKPSAEFTIVYDEGWPLASEAVHIARHDPARVLRQCAALRLILTEHDRTPGGHCSVCREFDYRRDYDAVAWPCPTVRAVASVWSDHPDYRP